MGCTCSRPTRASDETKNEIRRKNQNTNEIEADLGKNASKYVKIENEPNKPPDKSKKSSGKGCKNNNNNNGIGQNSQKESNNSLLKPFKDLFNKDPNRTSSTNSSLSSQPNLTNNDNTTSTKNPVTNNNNSSNLAVSQNTNNRNSTGQYKQSSQQSSSFYSLNNLPIKTQYLLNSHNDLESLKFCIDTTNDLDSSLSSSSIQKLNNKKLNSEIEVYLSLPFMSSSIDSILDNLLKYNIILIDKNLNECYNSVNREEEAETVFDNLRFYCAQHKTNNCDLNLINLNHYFSDKEENQASPTKRNISSSVLFTNFNLINNKYLKRSLSKLILSDLFNIKSNFFTNHQYNSFLSSFSLFLVYLSEIQFEQETNDNLLCPDQIDINDYKTYLDKNLNKSNLADLFHKYYKLDKNLQLYKLDIDFFNLSTNASSQTDLSSSFDEDLDKLMSFFVKLDDDFSIKHLKSIQQIEIELIIQNADPKSIIWAHLTKTGSSLSSSSSSTKSSLNFNKKRYSSVLNLLQTKVLTNKYKQIKLNPDQENDYTNESIMSNHKSILDDFVYESIKSLVDTFTSELSKNQIEIFALKIDKQLSKEIFKHYECYRYLKNLNYNNSNYSTIESVLNEYINDNSSVSWKYPLIVCNENKSSTCQTESAAYFNILISKWLYKLIQSNHQTPDNILKPSIIYRYCDHSILASELATLLQSIIHQLFYILEVHESCAFDSPENVIENLCKALEYYYSIAENEHKEIIILICNLNSIIRTNYDLNLLLNFLTSIYSITKRTNKTSNLKLIITMSTLTSIATNTNLINQLIEKVEQQFQSVAPNKSVLSNLSIDFNSSTNRYEFAHSYSTLNDKLNHILFKNNNETNIFNLTDLLIYLLRETRYGIKQSELFELILSSNLNLKTINKKQLNFIFTILWYSLKYYSNSIEFLNDNNQILYKLTSTKQVKKLNNELELNDLVYSFYNRSSSTKLNKSRLISYFNNRVFYELPKYFYQNNKLNNDCAQLKEFYLNEFILNPKWILNKTVISSNILYFLHDLVFFKNLLFELENNNNNNNDEEKLGELEQTKFNQLELFIYQKLYNLSQDQNQLYLYSKLEPNLESVLTNLEFIKKSIYLNNLPQLILFNPNDFDDHQATRCTLINFDQLNKELIYYSKIVYINKYCFLTISEQPYNEIKIWKISSLNNINLIRTIKFNKPPRDVRLINRHLAVVLIDRNLHLIDINNCIHVFDLNSTMNPSLALFEIHDSNHVVLLARNRLSVTLMKVPVNKPDAENVKVNIDDMFLFKVGEDRYLNSLLVSKNGKVMVCGDEVQKPFPLLVWNLNQRKLVYDLRQSKHEFITSIQSMSSSGKYVVSACQEEGEAKNCLIVYDLTTGQLFKKLKAKENYVCVEISEESNVIIACLENSQIFVYDLENGSKKFYINSNRYPINKIKILDNNKTFKNFFITYDTLGLDWTIRLWDLTKGDQLISSITCPSRIVSLDVNCSTFYFDDLLNDQAQEQDQDSSSAHNDLFLTACLYGIKKLFIVKLDFYSNNSNFNKLNTNFDKFNDDEALIGLQKEINL